MQLGRRRMQAVLILNLLLVLFMGIASGGGIMVSQYFGAKDRENLSHTVGTTITPHLFRRNRYHAVGAAPYPSPDDGA